MYVDSMTSLLNMKLSQRHSFNHTRFYYTLPLALNFTHNHLLTAKGPQYRHTAQAIMFLHKRTSQQHGKKVM